MANVLGLGWKKHLSLLFNTYCEWKYFQMTSFLNMNTYVYIYFAGYFVFVQPSAEGEGGRVHSSNDRTGQRRYRINTKNIISSLAEIYNLTLNK